MFGVVRLGLIGLTGLVWAHERYVLFVHVPAVPALHTSRADLLSCIAMAPKKRPAAASAAKDWFSNAAPHSLTGY